MRKLLFITLLIGGCVGSSGSGDAFFHKTLAALPMVAPYLAIDFKEITPDTKEADLGKQFPNLALECHEEPSNLGDRVCWDQIAWMNNLPADHVAFFYDRGRMVRIKVALDKAAYDDAVAHLNAQYGKHPRWIPDKEKNGQGLSVWTTGKGILVAEARRPELNETTLLWMSSKDLVAKRISRSLKRVPRVRNRRLPPSA